MSGAGPRLHAFPSAEPGTRPPLLFVHGGYTHAACWRYHFIPYFQQHGHDCFALDLSGHGESGGRDQLDRLGLDNFVRDLTQAVARLDRPPVLVGHSMGALIVQRYLEKNTAAGVALLSPVPPSGTASSAMRLAFTSPDFSSALARVLENNANEHALDTLARVYFSPDVDRHALLRYLPAIQPESARAVIEMLTPSYWSPNQRPALPALVMGGSEDAVFPPALLRFTASAWHTQPVVIPGAGHMLMLDPQWRDAARQLLVWLGRVAGTHTNTNTGTNEPATNS
jgi:pimeloyl-ACP methyl ester carboxylesterase